MIQSGRLPRFLQSGTMVLCVLRLEKEIQLKTKKSNTALWFFSFNLPCPCFHSVLPVSLDHLFGRQNLEKDTNGKLYTPKYIIRGEKKLILKWKMFGSLKTFFCHELHLRSVHAFFLFLDICPMLMFRKAGDVQPFDAQCWWSKHQKKIIILATTILMDRIYHFEEKNIRR